MRSGTKVLLATAAFASVHSLFASSKMKDAVAARFTSGRELYRVVYNGQALVTFGALLWFIGRQPKRTIYRVTGTGAVLMRVVQIAGVAFAVAAARATGIATLSGAGNLIAVLRGEATKTVPAAQGPEAGENGELRIEGPFRVVRHPLNLAPLAPFWFTPHMTTRRLMFNVVATAYLVIGSAHEERRLVRQYGDAYRRYQKKAPFYLPESPARLNTQ